MEDFSLFLKGFVSAMILFIWYVKGMQRGKRSPRSLLSVMVTLFCLTVLTVMNSSTLLPKVLVLIALVAVFMLECVEEKNHRINVGICLITILGIACVYFIVIGSFDKFTHKGGALLKSFHEVIIFGIVFLMLTFSDYIFKFFKVFIRIAYNMTTNTKNHKKTSDGLRKRRR